MKQKRSLKERVSDHRNQTTSAIRNNHIPTKQPKGEFKDFKIIDRDSNVLPHWAKEAPHIYFKDPSLNRNIGKLRIPLVFNNLLRSHTHNQNSCIALSPHPRENLLYLDFQHKRQLTLQTFLISIYNRRIIPMIKTFQTSRQLNPYISTFIQVQLKNSFQMLQNATFSKNI